MDLAELFQYVKDSIKKNGNLSPVAYDLWIKEVELVSFDSTLAVLSAGTPLKKDFLEKRYMDNMRAAFKEVLGVDIDIQVIVSGQEGAQPVMPAAETAVPSYQLDPQPAVPAMPSGMNSKNGDYEYTFETFIVGTSNKFAHAACLAVAQNPGKGYNPLFIYGGSGLGKTHLLYAIMSEIKKNRPDTKVVYVKGEDFTNELITAIQNKSTNEFREKYRPADVLLVDDIQFIAGKEQTQEEFFHTFETLHAAKKQIVLVSDRPPKEIKTLEERLRTRFEWGLLADIQPPDIETRIAIIKRKAELMSMDIPNDVAEYIANRIKSNIRQLEGVVKKINAYRTLAKQSPSIKVAENAIRDILSDNQPVPVTVERIISEVGRTYGVSSSDIRSSKRSSQISNARQIAMYVIRDITQMSMASIGEEFGGRDHSTVVYAINQVTKNIAQDAKYKETIEDIIKNIRDN
ncbi:MAG: chromosomal replication initiator protein DnaA [Oscillospiraceae bacterium]|nr:chromosomal replication initiator protein DnaA [Oscillospiraceae bacterium]